MRFPTRRFLALAVVLTSVLLGSGCNHSVRRGSAAALGNRVALALTVNGTDQPTPQQWAALLTALQPELAVYGLVLVDDLAQADRILRIDFTPDIISPNTAGRAVVLGWRANPLLRPAYAANSGATFSYPSYTSGMSAYNSSTFGYDRFGNYGYPSEKAGGSSGGSTTVLPSPSGKPHHPGNRRDDRPQGATPPAPGGHGRYAGGEHPRNQDRETRHRPEPSSSPSAGGSSYSAPAYSASPTSSSSSFSSSASSGSFSSSSASASSGSSSIGSSGTHESAARREN